MYTRLDPMQPFCRIASHTSEEVREILATLESEEGSVRGRRIGQMHIFWSRSHFPPAF